MTRFLLLIILFFYSINAYTQGWSELPSLNINYSIQCMATDTDGNIYVAGSFNDDNEKTYVLKWDGTSWSKLGDLNTNYTINDIAIDKNNNVYVGGAFTNSNDYYHVAKWDGTSWSQVGDNLFSIVNANSGIERIIIDSDNNIYVTGGFRNASIYCYIAKWNGVNWSEVGTGNNALKANFTIRDIVIDKNSNIYATGSFSNENGKTYVAKWDGTSWSQLGTGANALNGNDIIEAITVADDGTVYAAGAFTDNTVNHYRYVAKWDGTTWSKVGTLNSGGVFFCLILDANGDLLATNSDVYKWNKSEWEEVGSLNILTSVTSIIEDKSGKLYISAWTDVLKWDSEVTLITSSESKTVIQAYPNPTNNTININLYEDGIISVYNSLGELITNKNSSIGNNTIDLSNGSQGLYTLIFKGNNKTVYKPIQIVKQ